ncbi:putative peptidase [Lentzea pudingi]|uniref:Peptidase n=1 Tax=Lentzea pudingi TaxID=1789439 RepID=A0ABQ2IVH3_9PSEU|nr:M24 family metallopeptidase [Lentzea pudingi]GGN28706.1 putative peptidase [Lentzea pudingi]
MRWLPQFSHAERDRRWGLVRNGMAEAEVDALLVLGTDIFWGMGVANLQYLFHVEGQPACDGLLPLEGEPVVWAGTPHTTWPANRNLSVQSWCSDVRTREGMAGIAAEVRARGLERSRLGLVGFASAIQTTTVFLQGDIEALRRLLPDAEFVDSSQLLQDVRLVKSEEEIDRLRQAAAIARQTLRALIETARPGVTEADVYAEMARTHIAEGGEPSLFMLFGAGPVEHPSDELWNLLHAAEGPKTPTQRPLNQGDLVIAEWHTKYGGYRCHTECSVYLGPKAPDQLLRIWDVSQECLEASKSALRAGNTLREALREIRAPAARAGLDWVELGFHAMGAASPEFPTVIYEEGFGPPMLNGHGIGDFVLQEGMTFGNNVNLHDSAWKPDVGCMVADFMVVRPGRAEALVGVPVELPQVG